MTWQKIWRNVNQKSSFWWDEKKPLKSKWRPDSGSSDSESSRLWGTQKLSHACRLPIHTNKVPGTCTARTFVPAGRTLVQLNVEPHARSVLVGRTVVLVWQHRFSDFSRFAISRVKFKPLIRFRFRFRLCVPYT